MTAAILQSRHLTEFVDRLTENFEVIAPVKSRGDILFVQIDDAKEMALDYSNSSVSPKEFIFPQVERLFRYSTGRATFKLKEYKVERKRLIFGVRPCDVAGLRYLDASFGGDITDPSYWSKRASTRLVCIACEKPCTEACFCTSTGTGPFPTTGFDLALSPLRRGFLVEAPTQSGNSILRGHRQLLERSTRDDVREKEYQAEQARKRFRREVDIPGAVANMDRLFEDSIWENTAKRCLRCGGCTYVCPTCYCFNIFDKSQDSHGERLRHWDSCQLLGFGKRAGGLNARPTQTERLRQWYYHKFSYSLQQFGMLGCVGCGRCVETCIGNIDIAQVLNELAKR
jgi:sulfhydrogenase subunit beta (sulfur reductase)